MTKYVKSSDSILDIVDSKGKTRKVTQRAFDVVYKAKGFKVAEADQEETNVIPDYFTLSAEELKEITNDKLKAFLDEENIEYKSDATKKDLISLIIGE
ncbi:hypothetical protein GJU41_12730 [Bacillus idriensis]|uniref:HeH/LEM domain-containing protein n=1 Tax=Metabacillus idriensis TaxID=324768 RepID=A0A6I2M9G2_9BACI|nr:hypothetical protein [Metabacillus idriensis]MRX54840.1 hypothetical protein [Metabacillus idriensis]